MNLKEMIHQLDPAWTDPHFQLLVEVTQEDIDHGKRYLCRRCPVALALTRAAEAVKDQLKRPMRIKYDVFRLEGYVSGSRAYLNIFPEQSDYGREGAYCITPEEVERFVHLFDLNRAVSPFSVVMAFKAWHPDVVLPVRVDIDQEYQEYQE